MRTTIIKNWSDFEAKIDHISQSAVRTGHQDQLIYRGQSDARWTIQSTLERAAPRSAIEGIAYSEYYWRIMQAKTALESHSKERWDFDVLSPDQFRENISKLSDTGSSFSLPLPGGQEFYSYLIFLRHYGYPSPLVDFSQSPYVALLFAVLHQVSDWSSVYVSNSHHDHAITVGDNPIVRVLGQFVRTSARHYLQQCLYLCCAANTAKGWVFAPFASGLTSFNPQRLVIPRYAREDILARLLSMNMTPYVLSDGSLDALVETEWLRNEAKRSHIPKVVLIESTLDYDPVTADGLLTSEARNQIPGWLAANTTIDEHHCALELDGNDLPVSDGVDATRLKLHDLGPQLACYGAMENVVASGLIAPLQSHDYSLPFFRSARGKVAMALVEDIVSPEAIRIEHQYRDDTRYLGPETT